MKVDALLGTGFWFWLNKKGYKNVPKNISAFGTFIIKSICLLLVLLFFRSVTVLSDTTQSTLSNKISNATTTDTKDRGIHLPPIIMRHFELLLFGIAVLVAVSCSKNRRRIQRCFGRRCCKGFIYASFDLWYFKDKKAFDKLGLFRFSVKF